MDLKTKVSAKTRLKCGADVNSGDPLECSPFKRVYYLPPTTIAVFSRPRDKMGALLLGVACTGCPSGREDKQR